MSGYTLGKVELAPRRDTRGDWYLENNGDIAWRWKASPGIDCTVLGCTLHQPEPLTWWELEAKARYGR
jgi:hypothetical protein